MHDLELLTKVAPGEEGGTGGTDALVFDEEVPSPQVHEDNLEDTLAHFDDLNEHTKPSHDLGQTTNNKQPDIQPKEEETPNAEINILTRQPD